MLGNPAGFELCDGNAVCMITAWLMPAAGGIINDSLLFSETIDPFKFLIKTPLSFNYPVLKGTHHQNMTCYMCNCYNWVSCTSTSSENVKIVLKFWLAFLCKHVKKIPIIVKILLRYIFTFLYTAFTLVQLDFKLAF